MMKNPEAAEVRKRSANGSGGLRSGFSLERVRDIKEERGFEKGGNFWPAQNKNQSLVAVVSVDTLW